MSEQKIFAAMQAVMKEIGYVGKDKKNQQQGFKFRGVDDVMNALHGPLTRNGVFVTSYIADEVRSERPTKSGGTLFYTILRVVYRFNALDGSFVETMVIGEAMDSADKSTSKALSIAFKYAMMQVFSIPTEEQDDPDATTPDVDPITTAAPAKPVNWEKTVPKKEIVNHAPKLSPMQQVGNAMKGRNKEVIGTWIRARYPKIEPQSMTQGLAEEIIKKIGETPDEGFNLELSELQRSRK